jgi:hypothetical protein
VAPGFFGTFRYSCRLISLKNKQFYTNILGKR